MEEGGHTMRRHGRLLCRDGGVDSGEYIVFRLGEDGSRVSVRCIYVICNANVDGLFTPIPSI